jgi:rhamnosyltransferase
MMKASIVIPCYNGGQILHKCIETCLSQDVNFDYEIVVIDSSSSDGSREYLLEKSKANPRLRVYVIKKSDFGHGKTRNLGASYSRGELICFITQDAVPADQYWLLNMVKSMDKHPAAAGAFGRHRAHANHSAYTDHQLDMHFTSFGPGTVAYKAENLERYETDRGYRQRLHYYSDNNSCMRRSVWLKQPYDDVPFGEDQLWADKIIRQGYTKLYVDDSVVFHSHDFNIKESYQRGKEESIFFHKHFGYILKDSLWAVWKTSLYLTRKEYVFYISHSGRVRSLVKFPMILAIYLAALLGNYKGYQISSQQHISR